VPARITTGGKCTDSRTGEDEWTTVDTKTVKIGQDPVEVHFNNTRPFRVTDAGQNFYYKVKYSEYDQSGKDAMEQTGVVINAKIVPYKIYDPVMILNLVPMLMLIMLGSFFIERKLKKGIEAHESASGKSGRKNTKIQSKSSKSIFDSILKMLRRP
jgi:ATP-dependent Zn protease